MTKASIKELLAWAEPHAGADKGQNQYGYVLGAVGQVMTEELLTKLAKSAYPSSWQSYVNRGRKWIGRVCSDCNGLFEHYLNITLGGNYNTLARYNYSTWCAGFNGRDMSQMPQQAGTAVFADGGDEIVDHVGVLLRKYGNDSEDWYVIEAKGVDYGWIISKLPNGHWDRWGQMQKYFEYDVPAVDNVVVAPSPTPSSTSLKQGSTGQAVKDLQTKLNSLGFDCGQVDGDFGPKTEAAVEAFQTAAGIEVDGHVGPQTMAALAAYKKPEPIVIPIDPKPVYVPTRTLYLGCDGDDVKKMQHQLNIKGASPKLVEDGSFGPKTDQELRDFQKANGLEVDGRCGPKTSAKLWA